MREMAVTTREVKLRHCALGGQAVMWLLVHRDFDQPEGP